MAGFFSKLFGGKAGGADEAAKGEAVEYKGHRIRAAPFSAGGQFQIAGFIEKEIGGELKSYRFVRVDKLASRDDAISLATMKGQQIVDEQGDRIYDAAT